MADWRNAAMVWDAVLLQIADVRHGRTERSRSEEIDENSMFLLVSGKEARVWIRDIPYVIKAGGLFHVGRNMRAVIDPLGGACEYTLVAYRAECPQNAGRELTRMLVEENPFDSVTVLQPVAPAFSIRFQRIEAAWKSALPGCGLLIKGIFYEMLHAFYAEMQGKPSAGAAVDAAAWAQQYMQEHYDDVDSIQKMADMLSISRSTLYEQFRRRTGVSPQRYLTDLRLEAAQRALREGALTIPEIAAACGLKDKNYFFRVYRKRFGMTPGEYRSRFQGAAPACSQMHSVSSGALAQAQRGGVVIENFGRMHAYRRVPERIVCLSDSTAEICVALGAGKRIAALSQAEESLDDCAEAYRQTLSQIAVLPQRADGRQVPSYEAVCACRPEWVVGTSYSFHEQSGVADASAFERMGIHIYAMSATCKLNATFETTYEDVTNLGKILGQEKRARELVADMRKKEEALCQTGAWRRQATRVFVFDGMVRGSAFTCGQSLENHMIRMAGGRNVFEDRACQFACVSWQEVAQADPEVILVHRFFGGDDGERKAALLRDKPELAKTRAVRSGRIYVIGVKRIFPGLDNAAAAMEMERWFRQ
ncbi:MAG: AraC family transcriptional regulator [Clostridia bacterium]|nr:AraC family transcriptional regulator [Clostridia bacterium]